MEDRSTSGTPNASRLLEFLKEAYTKDDEVERLPLDKCGWRSIGEIAAGTGLPARRLYGKKPGDSGEDLKQLVKDRLIEIRYFKGERGRGGEVTRFRIVLSGNQRQRELAIGKVAVKRDLEPESVEVFGVDKKRIAVLPFANISPDPRDEYFADGMTEELISTFSRIRELKVISRTSVMRYKQTEKSLSEIAGELNVSAILEGSVRKMGNELRITAQLIDVRNDEHLWSEDYDRKFENVFSLQKDIAQRVADTLKLSFVSKERGGKKPTRNLEAYTLYLKARINRVRASVDSFNKTIDYLKQAIDLDPYFAQAYAEIAYCYAWGGAAGVLQEEKVFADGARFAEKAILLDDSIPESHLALGNVKLYLNWDFVGAEKEFRHALRLNPSFVDGQIDLANVLVLTRRFEEAVLEIRRALELDPLSAFTCTYAGLYFVFCRRWDEAIHAFKNAIELDSNSVLARDNLGYAYVQKGLLELGISELKKAIEFAGGNPGPYQLNDLVYSYVKSGRVAEASRILDDLLRSKQLKEFPRSVLGGIYTSLGEYDKALECLEKAFERHEGFLTQVNSDFSFEKLRPDPRFQALLKKIGFPDAD